MKAVLFLCGFSFLSSLILQAQPVSSNAVFDQITSVTALGNNQLLLTMFAGPQKAAVYDIATDSILYRFLPEGKGPGEATAVLSAIYDEEKSQFTFYSQNHKWIKTDLKGNLIQESNTTAISTVNHLENGFDGSSFLVFPSLYIPLQVIQEQKPIPVSLTIDSENLNVIDSLMLTTQELGLNEIKDVNKVNSVSVGLIGIQLDKDRTLLTYEGSRYLFLFKGKELIQKKAVDIPEHFGIRISTRNGHIGTQAAAYFSYLQRLENGTVLFSAGNTHQEIPFGATYAQVTDSDEFILHHENLYDTFHEEEGGYNHIIAGSKRIWFSNFYFTGYSLFIEELLEDE
ncbi:MAG: hypothetical protein WD016_00285 [Balneolaceae bacterium]